MPEAICINTKEHEAHNWSTVDRNPRRFQCPGVSALRASQFKNGKNCHSCREPLVEAAIRAGEDYCDKCMGGKDND